MFQARAGKRYRVEASVNLLDDFPIDIATVPPSGSDVMWTIPDVGGATQTRRFYHIEVLP